ncbi:MAG: hypothetical protein FJ304_00720 [Planctomycetes bacterium]|nr:hypothetical protein [Planctomycetota bacterium]
MSRFVRGDGPEEDPGSGAVWFPAGASHLFVRAGKELRALDPGTGTTVRTIPTPGTPLVVTPDGQRVYAYLGPRIVWRGGVRGDAPACACAVIEGFCLAQDAPMPRQETQQEIASVVLSRFVGSACYRLRALPEAVHEFGSVLLEFRQVVAICRERGEVLLVAMAID